MNPSNAFIRLALASCVVFLFQSGCTSGSEYREPVIPPKKLSILPPTSPLVHQRRVFDNEAGLKASVPYHPNIHYTWEASGPVRLTAGQDSPVVTFATAANLLTGSETDSALSRARLTVTMIDKQRHTQTQQSCELEIVRNVFLKSPHAFFPRAAHTATPLPGGRILFAGGYHFDALAHAELYDPLTDTFAPTGSLNTARAGHTATALPDGRVIAVGGYRLERSKLDTSADGKPILVASAEIYDPVTQTWQTLSTHDGLPKRHHAATLLPANKLLVLGGQTTRQGTGYGWSNTVCMLDLTTQQWSELTPLPNTLQYPVATTLSNGQVMVMGYEGREHIRAYLYDATSTPQGRCIPLSLESAQLPAQLRQTPLTLLALPQNGAVASGNDFFIHYQDQKWLPTAKPRHAFHLSRLSLCPLTNGDILAVNDKNQMVIYNGNAWGPVTAFPSLSPQCTLTAFPGSPYNDAGVILAGGCRSTPTREGNELMSEKTHFIHFKDNIPSMRESHGMLDVGAVLSNGLVITASAQETRLFDPCSNEWKTLHAPVGMDSFSFLSTKEKVFALWREGNPCIKVFMTDKKNWEDIKITNFNSNISIQGHSAIPLSEERVLITGLYQKGTDDMHSCILNLKNNKIENIVPMPFTCKYPTLCFIKESGQEKILLVGTPGTSPENAETAQTAYYDIEKNQWIGEVDLWDEVPSLSHLFSINGHLLGCRHFAEAGSKNQKKEDAIYQFMPSILPEESPWKLLTNALKGKSASHLFHIVPLENDSILCTGSRWSQIMHADKTGYRPMGNKNNFISAYFNVDRMGYKTLCAPCGPVQNRKDSKVLVWGGSPSGILEFYKPALF